MQSPIVLHPYVYAPNTKVKRKLLLNLKIS